MRTTLLTYPCDSSMVAPSCCLEYRPTGTFWAILIFIVLPLIFLVGKVIGTILTVLWRVLLGLTKLALWDDEDYDEEREELRLERQAELLAREEARMKRRQERALRRHQAVTRECTKINEKVTSLLANGVPRNGVAKCAPPTDDISESLNSECETDEQRVAPAVVSAVETTTINNGHVTLPDVPDQTEPPVLTNGHVTSPNATVIQLVLDWSRPILGVSLANSRRITDPRLQKWLKRHDVDHLIPGVRREVDRLVGARQLRLMTIHRPGLAAGPQTALSTMETADGRQKVDGREAGRGVDRGTATGMTRISHDASMKGEKELKEIGKLNEIDGGVYSKDRS
ncbi:hypothetical protein GCK32_002705 [Trichostrongylus colubriformis]|uniref:Uncharacterized protein n=1 Tax=Trichostrongylus colubriformis TaxID=6319 RepID=A0AAN8IDI8_TRICO